MGMVPTVGTGLFVATGQALAVGGPASLLISFGFISILVYCMATAVAEISAHSPVRNGTMVRHGYRYGSQSLGFSMGYLRWYSLAMLVPFELTTASVNLGLWSPGPKIAIRVSLMTVIMVGFNLLPEHAFKRSESLFTALKLFLIAGMLIFSIVLVSGGVPGTPALGFSYWNSPGAFTEYLASGSLGRFLGLLQCLLRTTIAFIFTPELSVIRAEGAQLSPRSNILRKAQTDNIQFSVLYVFLVVAIGMIAPSNDPMLTNNGVGAGISPFVLAVRTANIRILPNIVTLAILLSCVSSGRSFLFVSSQMLCSLSELGHGPAVFKLRTSWGVPYVAVITSALFAGFAYFSMMTSSSIVFNWMLHFISTSGYLSWLCSCIVYLRFRRAAEAQGVTRRYKAWIQPYGAYFAILFCTLLGLFNGFSFAVPSNLSVSQLVIAYIGIPMFLLLYLGHQLTLATGLRASSPEEISLERIETLDANTVVEEPPGRPETWWTKVKTSVEGPFRVCMRRRKTQESEV